jgi:3-hydroxyacyl-CoA dehydrogenase / enoyl-CoA hydratase / 3-hydroxybutyryl-CoA epimerase
MSAWTCNRDERGVATLTFDLPGEKVNKFTPEVMTDLNDILQKLLKEPCKCLLIRSAKEGVFIAGADIKDIQSIKDKHTSDEKLLRGQNVFNTLANCPFPTVAIINGACMGGGMELALACKERWASDHAKTRMGLPEVKLGLLPGWGGTQRLPKLVGLRAALDMILTGKTIDARKAIKMGLVDIAFGAEFIDDTVQKNTERLLKSNSQQKKPSKLSALDRFFDHSALGHKIVFHQARKSLQAKGGKDYPALNSILNLLEKSLNGPLQEGLRLEREYFSELITGSVAPNLIQVFFNSESIKKYSGDRSDKLKFNKAGVLGAGIMGGGIAWLFSSKGHAVRMKDLNLDALAKGHQSASNINKELIKRRKLTSSEASNLSTRIEGSINYQGFQKCNIIVEAVVEKMEIKKAVLKEAETHLDSTALLCSNTSALSITEMGKDLKHPERFIGLHFFNPVNRMPLIEIIPGEKTSAQTIAHAFQLALDLGKSPIIVKNCAGFLVNRILLAYMNEAARCLEDGAKIEQVDRIITNYGMPMGPFHLTDEVGIDVGYHVAKTLEQAYGQRMEVSSILTMVHQDMKLLGKKGNVGFYQWQGKEKHINASLQTTISQRSRRPELDDQAILDRCIMTMVKESSLCWEEKIAESAGHIDMAMILGTGFPPFRGGPLCYADQLGAKDCVQKLRRLSEQWGDRFTPNQALLDLEKNNQRHYSC